MNANHAKKYVRIAWTHSTQLNFALKWGGGGKGGKFLIDHTTVLSFSGHILADSRWWCDYIAQLGAGTGEGPALATGKKRPFTAACSVV